MTYVTHTQATSINRINYGISFQQLRASRIVVSEFVYDFILTLPHNNIVHKGESIPTCNTNSRNKTITNTGRYTPMNPHTLWIAPQPYTHL